MIKNKKNNRLRVDTRLEPIHDRPPSSDIELSEGTHSTASTLFLLKIKGNIKKVLVSLVVVLFGISAFAATAFAKGWANEEE